MLSPSLLRVFTLAPCKLNAHGCGTHTHEHTHTCRATDTVSCATLAVHNWNCMRLTNRFHRTLKHSPPFDICDMLDRSSNVPSMLLLFCAQLSSLGQIGLGAVLLWDHVSFNELVVNSFWKPAAMLIGEGVIGLLVCWLGWNSTRKKNRCNLGLVSECAMVVRCERVIRNIWNLVYGIAVLYAASVVVLHAFVCRLLGARTARCPAQNRLGTIRILAGHHIRQVFPQPQVRDQSHLEPHSGGGTHARCLWYAHIVLT